MISVSEARYLKHAGEEIDVKVSIRIIGCQPVIRIRDEEFHSFDRALVCLRHIVESEIARPLSNEDGLAWFEKQLDDFDTDQADESDEVGCWWLQS